MRTQDKIGNKDLRRKTHVKTSRGRKSSSTKWLNRQINDPYVKKAHQMGYRARAVFKLLEINEKYRILKQGMSVIDLGCAPGSWLQVAVETCGKGNVAGIDLLEVKPVEGAEIIQGDFTSNEGLNAVEEALRKISKTEEGETPKCNVVLSDMAANTTGFKQADHIRTIALAEMALDFAINNLKPGGTFVCKVFQGGASPELLKLAKTKFLNVGHFKPPSSRKGSVETFLIARNFKG
ncbi:MAG: RlmE family RNA methyltransferase [Alphaproteobacteria bacterium]|jgi:23S rRNA (uridine2552-2'-O)-methyltransferase|nr:RlmE family RNA methyltransferase [Alphaproteobacteria bacterium]